MPELTRLSRPYGGVALVTFADHAIANNLSWAGATAIADSLREARESGARVTVLASDMKGHWLEHAWLKDLIAGLRGEPTTASGRGFYSTLAELTNEEVITIAAVDGDTSGGGCELGWACDLRVAGEGSRFSQPEALMGIPSGIGGTARLTRLIGPTAAAEMVLDGRPFTATRLHQLGAINRVVPDGEATRHAVEWAAELATRSHDALVALKRTLKTSMELPLTEALREEQANFQSVAQTAHAQEQMQDVQDRLDSGATFRELYGEPTERLDD